MHVEDFKKICIENKPGIVVQRYLIESPSFFFSDVFEGEEFDFKRDIASILKVHIRDVVIVGSGKLGFSLKPDNSGLGIYPFKVFDSEYVQEISEIKSDLDIAVISSGLFDEQLKNLYDHTSHYTSPDFKEQRRKEFAKYILKGRFAIRLLPDDFPMTKEIAKVQEKYRELYARDVNIEIYKSWHFFETYHENNIRNIQMNLMR